MGRLLMSCAIVSVVGCGEATDSQPSTSDPKAIVTTCDAVCRQLLACVPNGDVNQCVANCKQMRPICRECLAGSTCGELNDKKCDDVCLGAPPPPPDPSCQVVTYEVGGFGSVGGAPGEACIHGAQCLSGRCVNAELDEVTTKSWCSNMGDCRNPQSDAETCPSGWSCNQIAEFPDDSKESWVCLPPSVKPCP